MHRPPHFALSLLVLVGVTLLLAASVPSVSVGGTAGAPPTGLARSPGSSGALPGPHPLTESFGAVQRTLILYNQSSVPGNVWADFTSSPGAVAYDPANGTAWATSVQAIDVLDAASDSGVRLIPAIDPDAIVYDNVSNTMWVTDDSVYANVTVYDASTYAIERTIPVGYDPDAIAFDWRSGDMFVANYDSANVTVLDATDYALAGTVAVGSFPDGVAVDTGLNEAIVANKESHNLTVIDATDLDVSGSIGFGAANYPGTELYDPENGRVYVAGSQGGVGIVNLSVPYLDGNVSGPGYDPADGLALDLANDELFVAEEQLWNVSWFAANSTIELGSVGTGAYSFPQGLAFDPVDDLVLATDTDGFLYASSNVTEISVATGRLTGSVGVERLPTGIAYSAAHNAEYVYDGGTGRLYQLDPASDTVVRSAFVGYTGHDILYLSGSVAYDPVNDTLYVGFFDPTPGLSGVAVVNATTFAVTYLPATDFDGPSGIAYDPTDHAVFVANYYNETVTELSTLGASEVRWIPVGDRPTGVVFDPANDGLYVSNNFDDTVSVLDVAASVVVATVSVGGGPAGLVVDPANGLVYVANSLSNNLTAISGATNTTVQNIPLGLIGSPYFLTWDPVNETIIASSALSAPGIAGVSLVNATNATFYGSIALGDIDAGVSYDPVAQELFAVGAYPGAVYAVALGNVSSPTTPLSATLGATPDPVLIGSSTTIRTATFGGTGPFSYAYSTLPSGCPYVDEASFACTPARVGLYVIGVNVTGSDAETASATALLNVTASSLSGGLHVSLELDPASLGLGATSIVSTGVSGAVGTVSYAYLDLPGGCSAGNVSSFPCDPSAAGTYTLKVDVTTSAGQSGNASATLTVTSPAGPAPAGLALVGWIAIGAVVVLAIVLILLVLRRRRRGTPAAPPPVAPSPPPGPPPPPPAG